MRLFVGIALAQAVTDELTKLTGRLHRKDDGLRWSLPESWHVTLQFLGSTERDPYECVLARLGEIHLPPILVQIDDLGFFERAGIFFAGVASSPELAALERHVVAATTLCGFTPETRPYHPHITLARSKGKDGLRSMLQLRSTLQRQISFSGFLADEFCLYESRPTPTGSRYEVRKRFQLGR